MANKLSIGTYIKKVFLTMAAAVGITALTCYMCLVPLAEYVWPLLLNASGTGMSGLYYILMFGGLAWIVMAQYKMFDWSQGAVVGSLLGYSILMGVVMMPLISFSVSINPYLVMKAFVVAAAMFVCMALFGYKTEKDLSFLRVFLLCGMVGLILVGIASIFFPFGGTTSTIICAVGVLVFALFTAYDMQFLKRVFNSVPSDAADRFVISGALHMYISFVAMFQYILSLMSGNK
jgi:FtsH-binding integral membrane protein